MSANLPERINFILRASRIRRYHNRITLLEDHVGSHSMRVAWFVSQIAEEPRADLLMAAITHDCAEVIIGDAPAPVKAKIRTSYNEMEFDALAKMGLENYEARLTPSELVILKLADRLDGLLYSLLEWKGLGNKNLASVAYTYDHYLWKQLEDLKGSELRERTCVLRDAIWSSFDLPVTYHPEATCLGVHNQPTRDKSGGVITRWAERNTGIESPA